jgi:hypothetical protein
VSGYSCVTFAKPAMMPAGFRCGVVETATAAAHIRSITQTNRRVCGAVLHRIKIISPPFAMGNDDHSDPDIHALEPKRLRALIIGCKFSWVQPDRV